ncbi:MAG: cyclopropane fatty acyl phospholipid synthase [Gammaproteobacteria bacterium]|nr:cyclopropane fatty acyl phospholipid synthase [Gammaproteobacteria bacterium]
MSARKRAISDVGERLVSIKDRFNAKDVIWDFADQIDVTINGDDPWDLQVLDERFYQRVVAESSLGMGESYMDGWWECEAIDELISRIMSIRIRDMLGRLSPALFGVWVESKVRNRQNRPRSYKVADMHYNLSNDMYRQMLGDTMAYTCGYWKNARTLDDAQRAKFDLVCRKLDLKPGERVLELGCGWGGFANFAAANYGCRVVSMNISSEQIRYAREHFANELIEFHWCDYRDVETYNPHGEQFDKIVSIGMCEHVGVKNYRTWLSTVHDQLVEHGLFLLHTIGTDKYSTKGDPWYDRYIFPNGMLPSPKSLGRAIDGLLVVEDWHNFGPDYDRTLLAWFERFDAYWQAGARDSTDFGATAPTRERFYRMWKYYLLSCAGTFRCRFTSLWQLVLSKRGVIGGYQSIR